MLERKKPRNVTLEEINSTERNCVAVTGAIKVNEKENVTHVTYS